MSTLITTDISDLTLNTRLIKIVSSKGEIVIDIKQLLQEPVNSINAYFNATRIADFYPNHKKLSKFMSLQSTKEYIEILDEEFSLISPKRGQSKIKTSYVKRGRETEETRGAFGTYLHNELFFKYLSWCDARFEREIHRIMKVIILNSNELKIERANTKALFHPLTDTIKNYYIQNQQSDNAKKFAYSSLLTMINMIVLGSTSKKYATENNIEIEKGKTIRDYLGQDKLGEIKKLEEHLNGLILYGKIYKYDTLKEELIKFN